MEQFLNLLLGINSEVYNFIFLVLGILLVALVGFVSVYVGRSERFVSLKHYWDLIDDAAIDLILTVAYGDIDLQPYEDEAQRLLEEDEYSIDPRMLYVVRNLEQQSRKYLGYRPDFVSIHRRAERVFQLLRQDPNKPEV